MFPIRKLATSPQNRSACSTSRRGPGTIPYIISAPITSAMDALPGTPSVRVGMKAVWVAELLAASGTATPSIAPLPNAARLGETFFSTA